MKAKLSVIFLLMTFFLNFQIHGSLKQRNRTIVTCQGAGTGTITSQAYIIDINTKATMTIVPVGIFALAPVIMPKRNLALIANAGPGGNSDTDLIVIDLETNANKQTLDTQGISSNTLPVVSKDEKLVLLSTQLSNLGQLLIIDSSSIPFTITKTITYNYNSFQPVIAYNDDQAAYALVSLSNSTVSIVNLTDSTFTDVKVPVGSSPQTPVIGYKDNKATWAVVSNKGSSNVSIIDLTDPSFPVSTIGVADSPLEASIASNNGNSTVALVTNSGSSTVSVIGLADKNFPVLAAVQVGTNPQVPTIASTNGKSTLALVSNLESNFANGTVSVIDLTKSSFPILKTVNVGYQPTPAVLANDGNSQYLALVANNNDTGSISIIDLRGSDFSVKNRSVSGYPIQPGIGYINGKPTVAVVSNTNSSSVSLIDLKDKSYPVVKTLGVFDNPQIPAVYLFEYHNEDVLYDLSRTSTPIYYQVP